MSSVLRSSRYKRRAVAALTLLVVLWVLVGAQPATSLGLLRVHVIDVGQGDAIYIKLPNGDDLLVDGGKPAAGPTVVAYLLAQGVDDLELLVATHGDEDHIGGLPAVLAAYTVEAAWLDSQDCATQVCARFYQGLAAQGTPVTLVRAGTSETRGDVALLVLNPAEPLYADRNNNSVVLRLSLGTVDVLLTGDAETGAEGRMLASGLPLEAEILKVAHHGSNSSSGAEFLAVVQPKAALISVGSNSYGHPREEVLQRLAAAGATVWRTDRVGTLVVTTDGTHYSLYGETQYRLFIPLVARSWN